jgi:multiple sugar transport system permease protein
MGLWGAGGNMIIWLAGLKGIPTHLYEAAKIDGAGRFRMFLSVTLPMLSPYILFNLIMGLIGAFQIFTQAFIMTRGGPVDTTLFYAYALFNNAFQYMKMGYASALAWVLFGIILTLTILQLRLSKRWVHYESET